ncbi:MAG: hypothetical protein FJW31_05340 [Acidobacteria bacterium]|nr:hypothetical protein [Acidobacteriota bacterium]
MYFDQSSFHVRCEWGLHGLRAIRASIDAVIVVDVLSFSTAVDVIISGGASVFPYRWRDDSAQRFTHEKGALLASRRTEVGFSLSPNSLLTLPAGVELVLPSPNGGTLSLETDGIPTFAACLRNARHVARCAATRGRRIAVIPAGERWQDETIRPCVEDLIGAGAVLSELPGTKSPEAEVAIAAFMAARMNLEAVLRSYSSGRELIEAGFGADVGLAAQYDVSSAVPLLHGDRFLHDRTADH